MATDPFSAAPKLVTENDTLKLDWDGTKKVIPLVLAGPILRHVERDSVTVWIALKEKRTVELSVMDGSGSVVLSGSRETVELGEYLHVVAVTASADSNVLANDAIYTYDLTFEKNGSVSEGSLATSGVLENGIGDVTFADTTDAPDRPSFATPPSDLDDLRVAYGSCRKPHGEGWDALPAVHTMITEDVTDPGTRPHHLVLGGDQIYADDVAGGLLAMLTNHANALLDWEESLPVPDGDRPLSSFEPGAREEAIVGTAGLSAENVGKSHLMGLGEYYAMYLCAWSDVLWPPADSMDAFPDPWVVYPPPNTVSWYEKEGKTWAKIVAAAGVIHVPQEDVPKHFSDMATAVENMSNVEKFRRTLPDVRRVLANVPTYMVFDDHEVTDDWFLNEKWVRDAVGTDLGHRIIQNGMTACAAFQAWGNAPEQFSTPGEPGAELLAAIEGGTDGGQNLDAEAIDERLGVPAVGDSIDFHEGSPKRIDWHFTVDFGAYELIALDTRTHRGYDGPEEPPQLVPMSVVADQIPPKSDAVELSLVISPAPMWTVELVNVGQSVGKILYDFFNFLPWFDTVTGSEYADAEHWHMADQSQEGALSRLAQRGDDDGNGTTRSRYVILAGDVHHGYTTRFHYWGKTPYDPENGTHSSVTGYPYQSVAACLTASASKNEALKTRFLHDDGYFFDLGDPPTVRRVGAHAEGSAVATRVTDSYPEDNLLVWDNAWVWQQARQLESEADWEYRVDFLEGTRPDTEQWLKDEGINPDLVDGWEAWNYYWDPSEGVEIVGVNNVGEMRLTWNNHTKEVVNRHWWRLKSDADEGDARLPLKPITTATVNLGFDDTTAYQPPTKE